MVHSLKCHNHLVISQILIIKSVPCRLRIYLDVQIFPCIKLVNEHHEMIKKYECQKFEGANQFREKECNIEEETDQYTEPQKLLLRHFLTVL